MPYIGGLPSVRRILGKRWLDNSLSVRLLTDIREFNRFNSETISVFSQLGEIRHLPGLHAKIFIIDDTCLLTSANLTNTAFTRRHEIGMFLEGPRSSKAISIFNTWWRTSPPASPSALKKFRKKKFISSEETDNFGGLPHHWNLPDDPGGMNYWLKPIGVTGDPISEDRVFNKLKERLDFSKVRPKGVKIGDTLIAYGVGAKRILSVYKVTSDPAFDKTHQRWPWYVMGQNLTPRFGRLWATHNLFAETIREEYLQRYPKRHITKVGGTTFGGLNLGKDKLRLDPDFAQYLIRRVSNHN